jgi:hypothetical protein
LGIIWYLVAAIVLRDGKPGKLLAVCCGLTPRLPVVPTGNSATCKSTHRHAQLDCHIDPLLPSPEGRQLLHAWTWQNKSDVCSTAHAYSALASCITLAPTNDRNHASRLLRQKCTLPRSDVRSVHECDAQSGLGPYGGATACCQGSKAHLPAVVAALQLQPLLLSASALSATAHRAQGGGTQRGGLQPSSPTPCCYTPPVAWPAYGSASAKRWLPAPAMSGRAEHRASHSSGRCEAVSPATATCVGLNGRASHALHRQDTRAGAGGPARRLRGAWPFFHGLSHWQRRLLARGPRGGVAADADARRHLP